MSHFQTAMAFTREWEGGFVNDPIDPGGATKYGISLRFLRSLEPKLGDIDGDVDVDADDIMSLSPEKAVTIYRSEFWDKMGLDRFKPVISVPVFDTAVNMGRSRAVKILQETLSSFGLMVAADGVIGHQTIYAAEQAKPEAFADRFCMERMATYVRIVKASPALSRFFYGWANRTVALAQKVRTL